MRSITAVEIGADTCALASTSVRAQELYVTAAETLDPASFPGIEAFTMALQQTRKALKLPRRCRAVVWGLPDGATRRDPVVAPLIEPLTRAGFKVARVVTPCNALGALARLRTSRSGGAMCWLGINRNGVAIIVIRPGKLLYSHSFAWDSNVGASGSQARLLQRYSLVAFLAPEVRRAIAAAQQKDATIDGIVTCGNLPDLRSLTMPLIEELDIEVETLDSLEGLQMKPELADRLSEVAPAIRLACAGAFARETRTVDEAKRKRARRSTAAASLLRIAALLAVLAAAGYWYYFRSVSPKSGVPQGSGAAASKSTEVPPKPASREAAQKASPPPAVVTKAQDKPIAPPPIVTTAPQQPVTPPPVVTRAPERAATPPPVVTRGPEKPATPPPVVTRGPEKPATPPPAVPKAPEKPPTTPPAVTKPPEKPATAPVVTKAPERTTTPPPVAAKQPDKTVATPPKQPAPSPAPSASSAPATVPGVRGAVNPPAATTDKPGAGSAVRVPAGRASEPLGPMPELLKDPVPRVTAILVAADRRLATVGDEGQIIAVGDTIGRRVVVGIDDRTVLLREPSGVQIRVALGGRVVGVERGGRL